MSKLKVAFVGSFSKPKDGSTGGQLFACMSLLESPISEQVEWITIDSTQVSNPLPPLWFRIMKAGGRILSFTRCVSIGGADAALIFSASGFSLYEKGMMTCIARLFGKPVIFGPRGSGVGRATGLKRALARFFLKQSSIILCQSTQWQDFYRELTGLPLARIAVIANWIDTKSYRILGEPPPREKLQVLYLGWMHKLKGVYDLPEAVRMEKEAFAGTVFVMCGGGDELEPFKERVAQYGLQDYFDMRGWVQGAEKMKALEEADIFVLPSYGEGMPNSVMEAMVAGKAVISTRVGGVPDMITHEVDGLLYEPRDVNALTDCLKTLIGDRQKRLDFGKRARERSLACHNIETSWPKVLALIKAATA